MLADPPEDHWHLGHLGGLRSGARQRRWINLSLALAMIGAVVAGVLYARHLRRERESVQFLQLPEGADLEGRERVLTWSNGKARLGLHRAPPGVLAIELPDRVIRLADDADVAQLRVNIVDGRTVEMTVLLGEVDVELREGADDR